ncbi:hypothetical protein [Ectothiorhodospira variabilis]|nr:hypothetical protein [Ectothiorhodospira variabilis]
MDGDQLHRLVRAIMTDGVDRVIDMATGCRYVARVAKEVDHVAA